MTEPEDTLLSATRVRTSAPSISIDANSCLDEDVILDLLDHRLSPEQESIAEKHIDGCEACRQLVAGSAKVAALPRTPTSGEENDAPPSLSPGDLVEHFEIKRLLGRGGMGEIYLARDTRLKRNVALKLVSKALVGSAEAKERFLLEARATARFNHPHIVTIHSVGEHGGRPYLALEFLEGETLREMADARQIATQDCLRYGLAIAEALQVAHQHGILHRDLKPGNVMIGADGRLRVLDFGLAKVVRRPLETPNDTESFIGADTTGEADSIRGTPGYMAPEQWRGEPVTAAADVWALGVILYEIVSGARPYRESSAVSYAVKVCEPTPAPALPFDTQAPAVVAELVARCLEKDPARRPSAAEVVNILKDLLRDDPGVIVLELERAAARWVEAGSPDRLLLDAVRLGEIERRLGQSSIALDGPAVGYFAASARKASELERRKRVRFMIASALASTFGALALVFAYTALVKAREAEEGRLEADRERAGALIEGARAALSRDDALEARAKLRTALEIGDSVLGRVLWWKMRTRPVVWSRRLGTGIYDVAFSPDGTAIAAAGQDRIVHVLDVRTLSSKSLRGHGDQVMKVAFAPDGSKIASGSWSGEVRLWSLSDDSVRVLRDKGKRPTALAFSPDGAKVFGADDGGGVTEWSVSGGASRAWPAEVTGVEDIAVTSRGVFTADRDGRVRLRDPSDGALIGESTAEGGALFSVAVDPSGRFVAAGGENLAVYLWKSDTLQLAGQWTGHSGAIRRVRFHPDGRWLIAATQDGTVSVRDTSSGESRVLGRHDGPAWGLAPSPSRDELVSAGLDGAVRLWTLEPGARAEVREGHADGVACVAFTSDGQRLLSGGYDQVVRVWDSRTGRQTQVLEGHTGTIYGVSADTRGDRWATGSHDGTVRIWRAAGGDTERILRGHERGVYGVAFSPDGTRLASASADETIRVWDVATGHTTAVLSGHGAPVFAVAWSPDGKRIASGGRDGTARVWEAGGGGRPAVFTGHEGHVWGVAFSPDGKTLATASFDQTVRLWELARPSESGRILGRHGGRVYTVAFHPGGGRVSAGSADGKVSIWDVQSGDRRELEGHRAEVNQVRFSRDGALLASASDDGTVRTWAVDTGRPAWNAPILTETALATQDGWQPLPGSGAVAEGPWMARARAAARRGSVRAGKACFSTFDGRLELWDATSGERRFDAAIEEVRGIWALSDGCVVDQRGSVRRYDASGAFRELRPDAAAVSVTGAEGAEVILIATADRAYVHDRAGAAVRSLPVAPGVRALTEIGGRLVVGFDNGTLEIAGDAKDLTFEGTPSSPPTRLTPGPMQTLVVGYANGRLGIWNVANGDKLHEAWLHGPVEHTISDGGRIVAATSLGGVFMGPDVFELEHCALMREVWRKVEVIWRGGLPILAPPPDLHPCAARKPH